MTEIHKVMEYKQAKTWIWEERKHILQFVIVADLKLVLCFLILPEFA